MDILSPILGNNSNYNNRRTGENIDSKKSAENASQDEPTFCGLNGSENEQNCRNLAPTSPNSYINNRAFSYFSNLTLANPNFRKPGSIDYLLVQMSSTGGSIQEDFHRIDGENGAILFTKTLGNSRKFFILPEKAAKWKEFARICRFFTKVEYSLQFC
ncbi:hypothetical protein JTB14_027274 [Gonioctena quinquepunctata]|nr:hypothetical protein JTB14_027274 [Gonioctena quinquepunctata]